MEKKRIPILLLLISLYRPQLTTSGEKLCYEHFIHKFQQIMSYLNCLDKFVVPFSYVGAVSRIEIDGASHYYLMLLHYRSFVNTAPLSMFL